MSERCRYRAPTEQAPGPAAEEQASVPVAGALTWCPVHGPGVQVSLTGQCLELRDEDGCPCLCRATGPGADAAVRALEEAVDLEATVAAVRASSAQRLARAVGAEMELAAALQTDAGEAHTARAYAIAARIMAERERDELRASLAAAHRETLTAETALAPLRAEVERLKAETEGERDSIRALVDAVDAVLQGAGIHHASRADAVRRIGAERTRARSLLAEIALWDSGALQGAAARTLLDRVREALEPT